MSASTILIPHKVNYVYKFTEAKKLDDKRTRMAAVEVFDIKGKKIGGYAFSRSPRNAFCEQVTYMVKELIRDYETRKIWNSKRATT